MNTEEISRTGKDHGFINHDPVCYPVTKISDATGNKITEPINNIPVYPATFILKLLWKIPVVKCDPGSYIKLQAKVNNPIVKVNASGINITCTIRKYAAPCY